ncbi:MAG TPA: hypothetical protein VIL30_16045 [Ramlibacter sp.]|jgi:hypothetical protein
MQSSLSHLRAFSHDLSDLGALSARDAIKHDQGLLLAPAAFCAGMAALALAAAFFFQ